jgi:tRNA (guanine37-N1)-methyltransferase
MICLYNLRDWATDKHNVTDDSPFGGGPGMVMKPEPIFAAIESLRSEYSRVIFLCPDGEIFNSAMAQKLSKEKHLILLSGHYEGVDERVRESLVDR